MAAKQDRVYPIGSIDCASPLSPVVFHEIALKTPSCAVNFQTSISVFTSLAACMAVAPYSPVCLD
jgi:hypothetical protein